MVGPRRWLGTSTGLEEEIQADSEARYKADEATASVPVTVVIH